MKLCVWTAVLAVGLSLAALAGTGVCFYESESVSGLHKICVYSCASGAAAITVSSTSLCPLSIHD
jgi:hypothetical protein